MDTYGICQWPNGWSFWNCSLLLPKGAGHVASVGAVARGGIFYEQISSPSPSPGEEVSWAIRFSLPDTPPENLMWMDPAPKATTYYTREVLDTSCCIPGYGFSVFGEVSVELNGTELVGLGGDFNNDDVPSRLGMNLGSYGQKRVSIELSKFGPGLYVVHCIAPVWNTTERVSHNRTIEVRDQKPMHFVSGTGAGNTTHVEWMSGEENQTLNCDAAGDPGPTSFTWEPDDAPGTFKTGSFLHIPIVSTSLPDMVMCTATNQFGDSITKDFHIDVKQSSLVVPVTVSALGAVVVLLTSIFVSIKLWRRARRAENLLTDEEVKEFLEGKPGYLPLIDLAGLPPATLEQAIEMDAEMGPEDDGNGSDNDDPICAADLQLSSKFEVNKSNFIVDHKSKLGEGAYGVVCKGHIKLNQHDRNPTPVAVKLVPSTLGTKTTKRFYLNALMSELKILAYIGQHPNICKLVGACWENIRQGTLWVGVEFCKTSLLQFLRDNRKLMENRRRGSRASLTDGLENGDERLITLSAMIRWASEIAAGMEFLSRKRVVHGDLAARNVLLTFDLNAKVYDFGLVRQLISTVYIKQTSAYMPWQWMAIESLRHREFSTRSDVWAFGVTLWELFTLGDTPYPTAQWTDDRAFLYRLVDGLRLPKPEFSSDEIYALMLDCWQENPANRPKFAELKRAFKSQLATENVDVNDE